MGTAGPLALARSILDNGDGSPFFVLNRCACACACGRQGGKAACRVDGLCGSLLLNRHVVHRA